MAKINQDVLVNIFSNSLRVIEKTTDVQRVELKVFDKGIITLNGFAIMQFLEGAKVITNAYIHKTFTAFEVNLILRLSEGLLSNLQNAEDCKIEVTYKDLQSLRTWLEARMSHCEKERDSRTMITCNGEQVEKFNADTYIGQKLLLLDLRELLLGEVVF